MFSIASGLQWVALATTSLLPAPAPVVAADLPPADQVVIDVVTVNGTGCQPGATSVSVLPDNTGFQLDFTDYRAEGGGSAFRRNCQLNLVVHAPEGFSYAVTGTRYAGRLELEAGVRAVQRSNFYYAGSPSIQFPPHTFAGPLSGDWQAADVVDPAALSFAPCGQTRNLNITTELRVDQDTAGWISMNSAEADVHSVVQFAWRRC